ncbi:hypothetical protein Z948_776 [Sulfitobacter donghicola DSW-25 = KCTC 12864 = JCM 14565]|nr:hypothetical protein Z948_776 [Sulfitobacter donghicola DSW-25 = KCTC 12864 = JCM 14565]
MHKHRGFNLMQNHPHSLPALANAGLGQSLCRLPLSGLKG